MIKLTRYTTTQISTTFAAVFLAVLILQSLDSLSIFKLFFYIVGSYILSLEFAALVFALRLPKKFYKRYQIEPLYSVSTVLLGLFALNATRSSAIVSLPLTLPLLTGILIALQFAYYKWFSVAPAKRKPKRR